MEKEYQKSRDYKKAIFQMEGQQPSFLFKYMGPHYSCYLWNSYLFKDNLQYRDYALTDVSKILLIISPDKNVLNNE